jgi:glycosyltransferase involved in cell wall biosynthesis
LEGGAIVSIKTYGIYLSYPPTVDLRAEGLGRHLAAFLNGAAEREDIRFVIVCPSWSKKSIQALCQSEKISEKSFDIITPKGGFFSLKVLEAYQFVLKKIKKHRLSVRKEKHQTSFLILNRLKIKLASARSLIDFMLFIPRAVTYCFLSLLLKLMVGLNNSLIGFISFINLKRHHSSRSLFHRVHAASLQPKDHDWVFDLFTHIERKENDLILTLINQMTHVRAWFSPTAFWPSFNNITAPKFMCVPDVVLAEFPIGFSNMGGDRILETFKKVETAILGSEYFVTYSDHIKQTILVKRYGMNPDKVRVVHHATNRLDSFLSDDCLDDKKTREVSQSLLLSAMKKSSYPAYTDAFSNVCVKFIFYASQFRPSKNVLTLLRAYRYLLRNRYISHKLILTGAPGKIAEIDAYIAKHHLAYDVLLLSRLSVPELAACYHLADLAVNPSLSEGGCPFTFTEALSVGTPVVMADIPVTTEIIQDPDLQAMMLFNPYDYKHLAARIEWALEHKEQLFDAQKATYNQLLKRTWRHVVDDYITFLDQLSHQK